MRLCRRKGGDCALLVSVLVFVLVTGCGPVSPTTVRQPADSPAPVSPTPAPAPAPTSAALLDPPVVYSYDGDLWAYDGATHRRLTEDGRSFDPSLSPDGRRLLFRRPRGNGAFYDLGVLDLATGEQRQLDLSVLPATDVDGTDLPHRPFQPVWEPAGRAILFNTAVDYSAVGPGGLVSWDDLWSADAQTGQVRNLFPGESPPASFSLSPDGRQVLISRPTRIELRSLDGGAGRTLLEFPAVATYSEYSWLPEPHWLPDGRYAHVAIGPEEPTESQEYALWRLDTQEGTSERMGTVQGSVFAWSPNGKSWSPDGSRLAYVTHLGDGWQVMVSAADGGNAQEVSRLENSAGVHGWSPDGRVFLFLSQGLLYWVDAGPALRVRILTEISVSPVEPIWRDRDLYMGVEGLYLLKVTDEGNAIESLRP